jgi:hypothetical protein
LLVGLVACWHTSPGPEPARWRDRSNPTLDLLPDGAWLVVELDIDTSQSAAQHENERKALSDPSSIKTADHGCQIPANHATFAAYGHDDFAIAMRGVFRADAMIDCIATMNGPDTVVTHSTIAGHDLLSTQKGANRPFLYVVSDSGVLIAANEPEMTRALADRLRSPTSDAKLAPLIARARAGGEAWAVARFPRDAPIVADVLSALGAKLGGRIAALTGSVHVTAPYRIEVDLELEQEADATLLGAALAKKQRELAALDKNLETLLGSLAIRVDHTHVHVIGAPDKIDWLQTLQGFIGVVARLRDAN